MTEKITSNSVSSRQLKQIKGLLGDEIEITDFPLTKKEAQEIIERGGDFKKSFNQVLTQFLANLELDSRKFGDPIVEFDLKIPTSYVHEKQLDEVYRQLKYETSTLAVEYWTKGYMNPDITDLKFAKTTDKLLPGKTYKIKIFPIINLNVTGEDCVKFMQRQKALFVSAQGLSLIREHALEKIPSEIGFISSYDKKENLPTRFWDQNVTLHHITYMEKKGALNLHIFEWKWNTKELACIICFYPKN